LFLSDGGATYGNLVDDIIGETNPSTAVLAAYGANVYLSGSSNDIVNDGTYNGPHVNLNITGEDPQLSGLANNGGPTQTMAITSSSPAFHAGIAIAGVTIDQRGQPRFDPPSLGAFEPQVATTTTANNATATFSQSAQSVTLSASVTSSAGTVNEGLVVFIVHQGGTPIGTPISGNVSNGFASVSYVLPAGTAAGSYNILAVYTPGPDFNFSEDDTHTLTVNPATPSISVADAGGTYNGTPFPATGTAPATDGTTPVAGNFSYAYYAGTGTAGTSLGATAPFNASTYTVVATFTSSDPNYTGGTAQTTFTITQAATSFSNLTVRQIVLGTSTTTVSGRLTSNTIIPVGQSVTITLNGVTQSATVGTDGNFSVPFATGALAVGQYTITYSYAGDANFDAASGLGSLTGAYQIGLLFDNTRAVHAGSVLPIKLALTDASGADASSPSIVVTATSLVDSNGNSLPLHSAGHANPGNVFRRYHESLEGYIFNLDTKGLASGTYTLYFTAGNDPTFHSLTFVVG
jgi:hypothetical protein